MAETQSCLIVDDSDVICEITSRIVGELGFETVQAVNAASAVERCHEQTRAIVLLDWDLPSMGALDFLRGIAQLDTETRPTIILCAAENDPQQFTLAKAAGAAAFILKPFDKSIIEAKFRELGLLEDVAPTDEAVNG